MKLRHSWWIVAALLVVGACRERATVTGTYGAGVVAGQVAVMGLENSSPAGVQVTVRGTGMTTTLAEDGAFTFADVPEGAVLVFQRADGINATLELRQSSGFVNVALSAGGATVTAGGGKRRSAGGTRKEYEFEGLVQSASATELVVFTSHQEEVTFTLDASTVIRKGQTTVAAEDLTEGTRVHVKAAKVGDAYTAILVIVQNAQVEVRSYEGTAKSATNTQLVVDVRGTDVTFVLTASTSIKKGNTTLSGSDIEAGDKVNVKALVAPDGTKTATEVRVQGGGNGKH